LLSEEERRLYEREWSSGTREIPFVSLSQILERDARLHPDHRVLVAPNGSLTLAQLDARVSNVAQRLRSAGVESGAIVAVCLPPSLELLPAILGILRAAAVYVPLDPTHPKARIHTILEEVQPTVIITTDELVGGLELQGWQSWRVDADPLIEADDLGVVSHDELRPESPAYIFYTSGTTGNPKGVVATHGNLMFYLQSAKTRYGFNALDVFCSIARSTFSISLFDLLSPIYCGGSLRLLDRTTILDPGSLRQALEEVTVLHAGPALLKALVRHIETFPSQRNGLNHLRHLSSGGDIVPPDLIERLKRHTGSAELFIIYGCTEVSCMGLTYPIARDIKMTRSLVGKPFPNVEVRVVDEQFQRVPVGVRGEIIFSGPGITSGYFQKPDLTESRYIELDGRRWYRTGDVGRFHPCGNVEILGREDFQIQLGGIRIELGEVEGVLKRAPGVRDAVVATRVPPGQEDAILVGYLVAEDEPVDIERVRRFALSELPDYMVPGVFMQLEALPLNINLKLDRKALPDLLPITTDTSQASNEAEVVVLEAMGEVLGSGEVDLNATLAELGCSSLSLLGFGSRILVRTGIQIPFSHLFAQGATLRNLASLLDSLKASGEGARRQIELLRAPDPCPLSLSQARIWFADVVQGQGLAYGVPLVFELAADVDIEALSRALQRLYRRHVVLRTTVVSNNAELYQGSLENEWWPLEVVSIRCDDLGGTLAERQARPFDLSQGPLAHVMLFFHFHHMIFDEFSSRILQRELTEFYSAEVTNRVAALPELAVSFADYAYSERQHWLSGAWDADLEYFRERFQVPVSPLDLPTDRPRTSAQSSVGGSVSCLLEGQALSQLRQLARSRSTSLFVLGVAAWGALMQRHSGQDEIVIGTAVANRLLPEAEKLIGCFINMVPLRIPVSIEQNVDGFLEATRTICLEAIEHSTVPFEAIVRVAGANRGSSGAELFRTLVIFEEQGEVEQGDLICGIKRPPLPGALTDLALWLVDRGDQLELVLSYNASLFDRETAELYVQQLETGLRYLAAGSWGAVGKWGFLSEIETERVGQWNRSTSKTVRPGSFLDWIRDQAAQQPERNAVVCSRGALSYRALFEDVAAIRVLLQELGVKPGSLVGVSVPRTHDLPVATLAVLYSGCGYVPLDPSYPEDRLRHMVEDSGLEVVLCRGAASHLPAAVKRIDLDAVNKASGVFDPVTVEPESVAYVIYTSGSTGLPKGVAVPHRAVDNFLDAMAFEPGIHSDDVLVSVTTLSFDISVLELFLPLSHGATVVIADEEQVRDGEALGSLLKTTGATVLQATPSTWKMLRDTGVDLAPGLRGLIGGEPLPRDLAEDLLSVGVELWNVYGPTETTVWSSCERISNSVKITVGRPIQNTSFYVLNPMGERQPIGAPGELYIGGTGVTLGYLNREELTAERFVRDPFGEAPLGKMYQTGDRIRLLRDGRYEHLGRLDGQVKLRGHRIELGEIESVVREMGFVDDCVASIHEFAPSDKRLVLFAQGCGELEITELRTQLRKRLPEYMLPQHLQVVEKIPRTANGKVDRKRISQLEVHWSQEAEGEEDGDASPIELQIASIFAEELGVGHVGRNDDFFDRGGHSLLAVKVIRRLEQAFNLKLPLGLLFEARTPKAVAQAVAGRSVREEVDVNVPSLVCLKKGTGNRPPIFFVHDGFGESVPYRNLTQLFDDGHAVYGILPKSKPHYPMLHSRVSEMVDYYIDLIFSAAYALGAF
jgi:amino acid adenylation domain-containing protein